MKYLRDLAQRFIKSRRAQVLAAIVVILVVSFFGARWLMFISGNASVEDVVREMEHRPSRPPKSPEYLGTLYLVNTVGDLKSVVCESNVSNDSSKKRKLERRIVKGTAEVSGIFWFLRMIKSGGESSAVSSVSFSDGAIIERDSASLHTIFKQLVKKKECREVLDKELGEGRCVAQSQSILVGTAEELTGDSSLVTVVSPSNKKTKKILSKAGFGGLKHKSGIELQYGLRLQDRCITGNTGLFRRFVPDERWWILKSSWNFMISIVEPVVLYLTHQEDITKKTASS